MEEFQESKDILIEQMIQYRKEKNLSQRALAYASHIPQSTLARIETGKTVPQLDTLVKLAEGMHMELAFREKRSVLPEVRRWDGLSFCVYWKNELVTKVQVTGTRVDIIRFVLHPVKQIFWTDQMDIFQLACVLETRCWERGRADIRDILTEWGLQEYDPLEIIKRTHGVSYNDFLWFQFAGEQFTYEDMKSGRCRKISVGDEI